MSFLDDAWDWTKGAVDWTVDAADDVADVLGDLKGVFGELGGLLGLGDGTKDTRNTRTQPVDPLNPASWPTGVWIAVGVGLVIFGPTIWRGIRKVVR